MHDNNTTTVTAEFESLKDASQRVALSVKPLRREMARGDLTPYHYGRRTIRVRPDEVNNLLKKQPNITQYGV